MATAAAGNAIKVVCRFRPLNSLEKRENSEIVFGIEDGSTVQLQSVGKAVGAEADGFAFDRAFPPESRQIEIFEFGVKEIVDGSLLSTRQ
jgi:kinesin family protein 5